MIYNEELIQSLEKLNKELCNGDLIIRLPESDGPLMYPWYQIGIKGYQPIKIHYRHLLEIMNNPDELKELFIKTIVPWYEKVKEDIEKRKDGHSS